MAAPFARPNVSALLLIDKTSNMAANAQDLNLKTGFIVTNDSRTSPCKVHAMK